MLVQIASTVKIFNSAHTNTQTHTSLIHERTENSQQPRGLVLLVVTRAFAIIALRICHCLEREFATHVVSSTAQCAFLNCRRRRRLQHAYTYEKVLGARL